MAVTCHLHLVCQDDPNLIRATAVTRWVEQTPKIVIIVESEPTLEKRILQPFEIAIF